MSRKRQKKTLFLIGEKKSPGENSKRNLLTSKHKSLNLLHSDKSTYFYKGKLLNKFLAPARYSTNDGRWTSPHCDLADSVQHPYHANRIRSSRGMPSYGRIAGQARNLLFILPACALLGLVNILINPSVIDGINVNNNVYAVDESRVSEKDTDDVSPDNATPSISLTLPDYTDTQLSQGVTIQQEVDSNTSVGHLSIDFNVVASNVDQYDIYVQSSNGVLIGEASGGKVSSITTDTTYSNMQSKAGWGYNVVKGKANTVDATTLTYKPIQTTVNTSVDGGSATNTTITQDYTLSFAASLKDMSPDHYKSNVVLSVAAGAGEVNEINLGFGNGDGFVTTMQEVGRKKDAGISVCDTMDFLDTGRLRDERDDKIYWVTKMYDGNCWMTQNLDLDLSIDRPLTSDDSDVTSDWTPRSSTISSTTALTTSNWPKYDNGQSYDSGWYVYTTPSVSKNTCGNSNGLADCIDKGWKKVDNTYVGYDAHYLSGNYYTWSAAAMDNTAVANRAVTSKNSICPKGWRLPAYAYSSEPYTFVDLGIDKGNAVIAPFYLVYSGIIFNGALSTAGNGGGYLTDTYYWKGDGYDQQVYVQVVGSLGASDYLQNRFYGYSVRCVAR